MLLHQQRIIDYPGLFESLRGYIDMMLESVHGEVEGGPMCIMFGNPGSPYPRDDHRIAVMKTAGGTQIGFHYVVDGITGRSYTSGQYIPMDTPDLKAAIIEKANRALQHYYKPHPNKMMDAMIWKNRDENQFEYYLQPFHQ